MAINLWKTGGKPTSYNPLPNGNTFVPLSIGEYIIRFKATVPSGAVFRLGGDNPNLTINGVAPYVIPSGVTGSYELAVKVTQAQNIALANISSSTGIIIDSIELVQKPLPKNTTNVKPLRYLLKKNLYSQGNQSLNGTDINPARTFDITEGIVQGGTYTLSGLFAIFGDDLSTNDRITLTLVYSDGAITTVNNGLNAQIRDGVERFVSVTATANPTKTLTTLRIWLFDYSTSGGKLHRTARNVQLEQSNTATSFERYQPVTPRSRTGLSFNGTSDYFQLPSMTMDSVEIECLIDVVQNNRYVIDARTGLANGYLYTSNVGNDGLGVGWVSATIDGNPATFPYPRNKRIKFKFNASLPFTDNVNIFSAYDGSTGSVLKGTLYKVTCYLSGNIVAQYDFENPSNIVGSTVIPSAKNLIPSFEDARWNLNANSQVLGKDVLRLNTPANNSPNDIIIDVLAGKTYLLNIEGNGINRTYDGGVIGVGSIFSTPKGTFTPTTNKIAIRLFNNNTAGTFDFIRPQLYVLDGKEGTINGAPVLQRKTSRRSQYAKR